MIFGGQLEGEFFNDVWVADFATREFPSDRLPRRAHHQISARSGYYHVEFIRTSWKDCPSTSDGPCHIELRGKGLPVRAPPSKLYYTLVDT